MSELSTIKIPEKVYVGFQGRRSQDEVPLGFMTPYTDDKAGEKRRSTVDSWAKGRGQEKAFNSVTLENKPMIGFKIGRAIRRSRRWNSSGASKVRIEDPRGFELEITIENLVMLMDGNLIEDGVLVGECVWGRDGGDNILLPLNSEPYKHSRTTLSAIANAISLRDIIPGDHIKLITGEEGIYFGSMYGIGRERWSNHGQVQVDKKRYVVKVQDTDGNWAYHSWAAIKVGEVIKKAEKKLTALEMETEISNALKINPGLCVSHSNGIDMLSGFMATPDFEIVKSEEISVTNQDIEKWMEDHYNQYYQNAFAENNNGEFLILSKHENFHKSRAKVGSPRSYSFYKNSSWNYSNCTTVTTTGYIGHKITRHSMTSWAEGDQLHFELSDTKRLFAIQTTVRSKNGIEYTITL